MNACCPRPLIATIVLMTCVIGNADAGPCTDVSYKALRPPTYPKEAIAAHTSGQTLVLVTVDAAGNPDRVSVQTSSGSVMLDDAALAAVKTWHFTPALCEGKPTTSRALIPVSFNLSEAASEASAYSYNVAADPDPMEFDTVGKALPYLRSLSGLTEHRLSSGYSFWGEGFSRTWSIREFPEYEWNAASGATRKLVTRLRPVSTPETSTVYYAFLCAGPSDWCSQVERREVEFLKDNPPPPLPPPMPDPNQENPPGT
jgi:protein TonB